MACRQNLETYLQQRKIEYEIQHHWPAFTPRNLAATEQVPGATRAKVVMVFAENDLTMLVMPAHFQVDLAATKAALGERDVRLAHESEFAPFFPDCEPSAMPPFGNLYGIRVYAEEALVGTEPIVFQIGTHAETMSVASNDFLRLARATVARLGFAPGSSARAS